MIVFDVATKVLDTEIFPQHTVADLNLWHYIHCFVQSEKVFTMKENKHTHARTHAHTHTAAVYLILGLFIYNSTCRFQEFVLYYHDASDILLLETGEVI